MLFVSEKKRTEKIEDKMHSLFFNPLESFSVLKILHDIKGCVNIMRRINYLKVYISIKYLLFFK